MPLREPRSGASVLPWEKDLQIEPAEADLPHLSVVIPIFNAGAFLEKTLRSLMCNDLTGVELILMDGGSADATPEIVEHYRDIFAAAVMEPDRGQSDAINKGFARATGEVFHWLNGDDLVLPNTLTAARRAFRDRPGTDVVVGDAYMTEADFTPIRHFRYGPEKLTFQHLLNYAENHLVQPSVFFSRAAWEAVGPCREDLHFSMDADLFLGMAARYDFVHLPIDIAYSVYHEECKTRGQRAESITELALTQARHGGFDEARETLDILVSLYNAAPGETVSGRRLKAVETEVARNRALLLGAAAGAGA